MGQLDEREYGFAEAKAVFSPQILVWCPDATSSLRYYFIVITWRDFDNYDVERIMPSAN